MEKSNIAILNFKNKSANNPLFILQRYNETTGLINNAKLRRYRDKTDQETCL